MSRSNLALGVDLGTTYSAPRAARRERCVVRDADLAPHRRARLRRTPSRALQPRLLTPRAAASACSATTRWRLSARLLPGAPVASLALSHTTPAPCPARLVLPLTRESPPRPRSANDQGNRRAPAGKGGWLRVPKEATSGDAFRAHPSRRRQAPAAPQPRGAAAAGATLVTRATPRHRG